MESVIDPSNKKVGIIFKGMALGVRHARSVPKQIKKQINAV